MKMYQSNTYRKDVSWLYFDSEPKVRERQQVKKLHRTNQGSNFLWDSFTWTYNVRAPIQFIRERQPYHLKRWFFLKNIPTGLILEIKHSIWWVLKRALFLQATTVGLQKENFALKILSDGQKQHPKT